MGKASTDKEIKSAQNAYDEAVKKNTGLEGYKNLRETGGTERSASLDTSRAYAAGDIYGAKQSKSANAMGASGANSQMANINSNAQKYAGQQASAAAAGAQSQATTAARAAGMNKAQAAMMGSQQNANAYQNAFGNAYGQQLGTANSAFENQANRANSNANQFAAMQNANNQYQQSLAASMMGANVSGIGNQVSMAQAQDAQNFRQGGLFSDERLKHYRECSKKVVMKTPSKIQSLKITTKGE
jgi:hypothetical protein